MNTSKLKKWSLTIRNGVFWVILWCIGLYVLNVMDTIERLSGANLIGITLALALFFGIPLAWVCDLIFIWDEE